MKAARLGWGVSCSKSSLLLLMLLLLLLLLVTYMLAAAVPLEADRQVVCLFSGVARGLPDAEEWDLSGSLVDGQPVSRQTVVAWLNAAYQAAYEVNFEAQKKPNNPACSMTGLYHLLSFADAVDSTKPVLKACCAQLQSLKLHAQLGQQPLMLETNGVGYYFSQIGQKLKCQADFSKCQRRRCSSSNNCRGAAGV
jgi:hypothetical protein